MVVLKEATQNKGDLNKVFTLSAFVVVRLINFKEISKILLILCKNDIRN